MRSDFLDVRIHHSQTTYPDARLQWLSWRELQAQVRREVTATLLLRDDMFDVQPEVVVILMQLAIHPAAGRTMPDKSLDDCIHQVVRDWASRCTPLRSMTG